LASAALCAAATLTGSRLPPGGEKLSGRSFRINFEARMPSPLPIAAPNPKGEHAQ